MQIYNQLSCNWINQS